MPSRHCMNQKCSIIVHITIHDITAKPHPPTTNSKGSSSYIDVTVQSISSRGTISNYCPSLMRSLQPNTYSYDRLPPLLGMCVHVSMHVCMCLRSLDKPSFGEQCSVGITVYGVCTVYCVLMVNQESKRRVVGGHSLPIDHVYNIHPRRFLRKDDGTCS